MTSPQPRLAATLLLIRDRGGLEVLMVERNERAYFASALVFPGGLVDPDDHHPDWLGHVDAPADLPVEERAIRIAALRELHEETGVFLTERAAPPRSPDAAAPRFIDAVAGSGARLDLDAVHPFAHWITPASSPKRYDTHFRLCGVGTELQAVSDGDETVSVEWIRPRDALRLGAAGERKLLFPTRMNLELLGRSSSVDEAIEAARTRTIVTITPRVEQRLEGVFITIPEDAGYGPAEEFVGPARPA